MHFVVGEELQWDVWGFDPEVAPTPRLKAFTTWRDKVEMGKTRGTYGRPEVRRWVDNVKMDLQEVGW
jgi:hypothetical protein